MLSAPCVPLTVTVSAWPSPAGPPTSAEVDLDLRDVRAGQVADGDVVGATERVEVDALDVVQVHRDRRHVAEEAHAPAVGEDVDVLGDVRAVEQHRVGAVLAFDVSLPSPGSHWNMSSPAPMKADVVALVAVDEVVAVAADQDVGAAAAEDRVVAGAAVERQLDDGRDERRRR